LNARRITADTRVALRQRSWRDETGLRLERSDHAQHCGSVRSGVVAALLDVMTVGEKEGEGAGAVVADEAGGRGRRVDQLGASVAEDADGARPIRE
jgi:hypothetical protein